MRARVPEEWLWELLRTPSFHTWQGERWLFCCRRPMAFAGEWDAEEFQRRSPDGDGWKLFQSVVEDAGEEVWNRLSSPDVGGPYVFRCPECERFSGYWDLS
jgi:uncharacterized protein CbrC (UPF0167 family)